MARRTLKPAYDFVAFSKAFYDFASRVTIVSKDSGTGLFEMYPIQQRLFDEIFEGLAQGKHWFVTLKCRQLGSTTGCLLLDVFWPACFPGLQGAIIAQNAQSMQKIRKLLEFVLENLPASHRLPIRSHNRDGIVFDAPGGTSMMDYLVAGEKKRGSGGSLGRSFAYNYCHMTEVSSYADEEGFTSLKDTFSREYPFRLYNEESTARGYGLFHDEWEDAGEDTLTKKQIFLSWWMHHKYQYPGDHPDGNELFARYGHPTLSGYEKETTKLVEEEYGHTITLEQWAWYRHRSDPRAEVQDTDVARDDREENVKQEYPSYPEEAFRETGSTFITGTHLTSLMKVAVATKFLGFRYRFGENVTTTSREPVEFARQAQLKVFQEPVDNGVYIVAGDPAFASSDESDRYCATVLRCYADRVEQVAVFCERNMETYEYTWVLVDLCSWYGNCRWIIDITASGEAVLTEFRHLRTQLETGKLNPARVDPENPTEIELEDERNLRNILSRVRTYFYRRADSLLGGYNIQFKTSLQLRHAVFVQLRDRIALKQCGVHDVDTVRELQGLRQDGMVIQPEGRKKDDRAVCLAMGVRCWLDKERDNLEMLGRTYANEHALAEGPAFNTNRYIEGLLAGEIAGKVKIRERRQRFERRQRWGW